jgi:hypothetical protein
MKMGGIVVERMMTGALRADGQRRMIGDTMKETKLLTGPTPREN